MSSAIHSLIILVSSPPLYLCRFYSTSQNMNCIGYPKIYLTHTLGRNIITFLHMLEMPQCISRGYCSFSQMLSTEGSVLTSICLAWLPQLMKSHLTRACYYCYDLAFYIIEFQLIPKYCRHSVPPVCYLSAFFCY